MPARLLLLLVLAVPAALQAQEPADYFPLETGNRWVWRGWDSGDPDLYYRLEIVGDTLIGGEAYVLATATTLLQIYQPIATSRCALRLVPEDLGAEIEEMLIAGPGPCLAPAIVSAADGPSVPGGEGKQQEVEIGGVFYELELVVRYDIQSSGGASGEGWFAVGVGPVRAWWTYNVSQGGGGYGSSLVYAEVGGEVYGVEPTAYDIPDPARFYPLGLGDTWVYRVHDAGMPEEWEVRTVVGDTTLAGLDYALVELSHHDMTDGSTLAEARCAVRYEAGGIEWVAVNGSCDPIDDELQSRAWWNPLDDPAPVSGDCEVAVGNEAYTVSHCFDIDWHSGMTYVGFLFAADIGFVRYNVSAPVPFPGATLVYAYVGGVEYGEGNPVAAEPTAAPVSAFAIEAAVPNPFRSAVALTLTLPAPEAVTVAVFDALGRRVWERDLGVLAAGTQRVTLDGAALAPGVYVVRATTTSGDVATRRMVRAE